jgi:clathrin heavy chain
VTKGDKECFTATLFTCYSLIRPDVAMELAWRARLTDSVMPFMIQYMRDTSKRIASLEAKLAPKEEEEHAAAAAAAAAGGMAAPGMGGMGMVSARAVPPLSEPTATKRSYAPPPPPSPPPSQLMISNEAYVPTLGGMGGIPGVPGFAGGGVPGGFPGGGGGYGAPPPFLGGGMPPPPPSY